MINAYLLNDNFIGRPGFESLSYASRELSNTKARAVDLNKVTIVSSIFVLEPDKFCESHGRLICKLDY
jgi:hypothetical protein